MIVLIVGALVAAALVSRVVWLVARRWPNSIKKAVLVNAVSAMITVIGGAFSSANGGPPKFYLAFLIFGGAQLIVLTFDLVGLIRFTSSTEPR